MERADTILIVDDTLPSLNRLSSVLQKQGYIVERATRGEQALAVVREQLPDLILLDTQLPDMDGFEVCRHLKACDRTCAIPILLLSGGAADTARIRAFDLEGVDYIAYPFRSEEMLIRVRNQLRIHHRHQFLQEQNLQLKQALGNLITDRPALEGNCSGGCHPECPADPALTLDLPPQDALLLPLQEQVQALLNREASLNTLKTQLLHTISHEFRTPLMVIMTTTEVLKQKRIKGDDGDLDRHFKKIISSVHRITEMVEGAILLCRAEAGDIVPEPEFLDLSSFCQLLVSSWELPTPKVHEIHFTCQGHQPDQVQIDWELMHQILSHSLKNAIRYSPDGGTIQVELIYQIDTVLFRVRDQGIGIPPDEIDRVCERFYRAKNADSIPGTPGAGLGLAIVKRLVEIQRGTLAIESQLERGTTVSISIPHSLG